MSTWDSAMRRAFALAKRGPAYGSNPQVGCVIVSQAGAIIAEGWHLGRGSDHAEIAALSKLGAKNLIGATAVVSLEPCNHTGVTGPCAEALIEAGISQVIYSVDDPGSHSSGGSNRLIEAGIKVTRGVLEEEGTELLQWWLTSATRGRPHVVAKWASSLDGRIAATDGTSKWLTHTTARDMVHKQRAEADAIIVSTGTVLSDNPQLTARTLSGKLIAHQPVPVVVGMRDIPKNSAIFSHPHQVVFEKTHDVHTLVKSMYERGYRRIYVEGGPALINAFVQSDLIDEYFIYLAPTLLGGSHLALSDIGVNTLKERHDLTIKSCVQLGEDLLIHARRKTEI